MTSLLARFRSSPGAFLRRAFNKLLAGRLRYARGRGYDAHRYWTDRLGKYGASLKGPGHEGLSEEANAAMYREAAEIFQEICQREGVRLDQANVLDIGCGNGFYTRLCRDLGVAHYTGVDITDVLFPRLAAEFPRFSFRRIDVTRDRIEGTFDLILMIDVVEHIVEPASLDVAMTAVRGCLKRTGLLVLALPLKAAGSKSLFYLRFWSLDDITQRFADHEIRRPLPFRDGHLIAIRQRLTTEAPGGSPPLPEDGE